MEMPYLYKEGPKIETIIRFRVGDPNLEGDLNIMKVCKGMLKMQKGRALQKGVQI